MASDERAPLEEFRMLSRDLYIPPGKIGFWQVAYRDNDAGRDDVLEAVRGGRLHASTSCTATTRAASASSRASASSARATGGR